MKQTALALLFALGLVGCGSEPAASNEPAASQETGSETSVAENNDAPETTVTEVAQNSDDESAGAQRQTYNTDIGPTIVNGYRELAWEDLMPEGEEERLAAMYQEQMAMLYSGGPIMEGSAADTMTQIGTFNVVDELDGQKVRLPGYTVPFEYGRDAEITEFLLVPYFGACIHAPPPPPNQTIFVEAKDAIKVTDLAQAVWINGVIRTSKQTTELADTAYTFDMESIEEYNY